MMFSILTQLGGCSKAVTSKWPRWHLDTYHFWTRVPPIGLSFLSSWFHLCFVHLFRFCLFGSLYQHLFMFRTPKLFLQTTFITVDALWRYLEYFCKPVATCSTFGALIISVKIHVCSEALSQCLSLVYIFPSLSFSHHSCNIHPPLLICSQHSSCFFFPFLRTLSVFQVHLNLNLVYDTQGLLLYILYVVCEACIVHYNASGVTLGEAVITCSVY